MKVNHIESGRGPPKVAPTTSNVAPPASQTTKYDMVFVNPRFWGSSESPLYGSLWMIAYLREHGYKAAYVDGEVLNLEPKDLAFHVRACYPSKYYGVSATSLNIGAAESLIVELKRDTRSRIALGGAHVTSTNDGLHGADAVIRGEGFAPVISFVQGDTRPVFFGEEMDLNKLPMPAWDLIDLKDYKGNHPRMAKPSTTTFTSIGCPHGCTFCSLIYKRPRFRDPGLVLDELDVLVNKGAKEVFFYDDEFNLVKKHAHAICDMLIEAGFNEELSFKCQMRASRHNWDDDLLEHMKEANFTVLMWGIESGSQKVLDKGIRKGLTVEDARDALRATFAVGLKNYTFFMVQNMYETWSDALNTWRFIYKNIGFIDYAQVTVATPYPGSELYREAIKGGWIVDDPDIKDTQHSIMDTPWMTRSQADWCKRRLDWEVQPARWKLNRIVRSIKRLIR